jgi:gamma-glutamyltranspeptidase / glutathione hydrolase
MNPLIDGYGLLFTRGLSPDQVSPEKVLVSSKSAVATQHPLASLAGYAAIESGGNAFDAVTAASFTLGVVLPQLSGLGGDFFALFKHGKTGKVYCINGSGWAPSGMTVDRLRSLGCAEMPRSGPNSAVVPGLVLGVHELHKRFGVMDFGRLLDRAIELAEGGFPISPGLARAITTTPGVRASLLGHGRDDGHAADQREDDQEEEGAERGKRKKRKKKRVPAIPSGVLLRQHDLAATLRRVVERGPDGFYSGETARLLRGAMSKGGLDVNAADLSEMRPEWVEPLESRYRGRQVFEVPPNSMGATTLLILRQLERLDPPRDPASPERIAQITEATKVAWQAKEEQLGDPRFVDFDLERFLSSTERPGQQRRLADRDTTYLSAADKEGNLLSCIQSLFQTFGARVYVEGGGFFLNNRASAFRYEGPNRVEPRKRPVHTLSALLLSRDAAAGEGGEGRTGTRGGIGRGGATRATAAPAPPPSIAIGTSAGELRPQLHALFVTNLIDYSMGLEEAIAFPRFAWDGSATRVEAGYHHHPLTRRPGRRDGLRRSARIGVAQGVELLPGEAKKKKSVCDGRGEGVPVGD